MDDSLCPSAREDLVCEELEGEVVIYDPKAKLTHRLNHTAAYIFLLCNGKTSIGKIKELYGTAFGLPVDIVDRDVRLVSENLHKSLIIGMGDQ